MIVTPIKTNSITAGDSTLFQVLDTYVDTMPANSVLAITSKIVSLCENRVTSLDLDKNDLIHYESAYYLPASDSKYGHRFTITRDTLIAGAGIDESNGQNQHILWPLDPQESANQIRQYLVDRFKLQNVGVIITDSTCTPLRRGTIGIVLSHSGFLGLHNYVGKPDLFGQPLKVTQSSIAGGLAASAVVTMGEGNEQTPLALLQDLPFVVFQSRNPNKDELHELLIAKEDDLFAPFLEKTEWLRGEGK